MGLLTFAINATLDGCCDHRAAAPDDELFRYWIRLMDAAGGMLWGRTVYELMENYWPAVARDPKAARLDREWARKLDAKDKFVLSTSRHLIDDLGFDAAINYHDGSLPKRLAKAAPEGFDVCVENVGGEQLEAAIAAMRPRGRIAWVGAIAQYNDPENPPPAPRNLYDVICKSLRLEGFLVREYGHAQSELEEFLVPHIRSGAVKLEETVVDGIENGVKAFLGVMKGENVGKMLVRVGS